MAIKYLSVDHVLLLHDIVLKNTIEDKNLSPDKSIDSAINRVADHVYYGGLEDLYEIATLYGIAISKGHCFNNGNKRTGMLSMVVFLSINGVHMKASDQEIEDLMVDIVEDRISQEEVAQWLRINAK